MNHMTPENHAQKALEALRAALSAASENADEYDVLSQFVDTIEAEVEGWKMHLEELEEEEYPV
jgi:hypothetical protein